MKNASLSSLTSGFTIGILGGGQLGRMLALSAASLGLKTHIYAPEADSPAFEVASTHTRAEYEDEAALRRFAASVDVITYEFENVPAQTAFVLDALKPVRPNVRALSVAQDRWVEKSFLRDLGIAVADFVAVDSVEDVHAALKTLGLPCVLKTRRFGYDGKGQVIIRSVEAAADAFHSLGGVACIAEAFVPFQAEVSMVVARTLNGQFAAFDLTLNHHRHHILHTSTVPSLMSAAIEQQAHAVAQKIADASAYIGVFAVEFFTLASGALLVNEIAPRVHNSGHWTMNACAVSQFEQHIRAVAGLPLGSPYRHSNAVMTNLIGDDVARWRDLLAQPHACLHLYGKNEARVGRKMGHVTQLSARSDAGTAENINLFSYGTLQLDSVQLASFGRLLHGCDDAVPGWCLEQIEILDPEVVRLSGQKFHPLMRPSIKADDQVIGRVFRLTAQELAAADRYEVSDYRRIEVVLASGATAWVYVAHT